MTTEELKAQILAYKESKPDVSDSDCLKDFVNKRQREFTWGQWFEAVGELTVEGSLSP